MSKIKYFFVPATLLLVNTLTFANESDHYDYNEFLFGLSTSSLNNSQIYTYSHSRSLSDTFYLTLDLSQRSPSHNSELFSSKAETGIGGHKAISDITDVFLEVAYSKTWHHGLNSDHFDSLHFKSGSIVDLTDKFQLRTEASFNKPLNHEIDFLSYKKQKEIDFEVAGKFKLPKSTLITGLSSTKGFPYFGMSFK